MSFIVINGDSVCPEETWSQPSTENYYTAGVSFSGSDSEVSLQQRPTSTQPGHP